MARIVAAVLLVSFASGCSGLLPRSETVTDSPWKTYADAEQTFDRIVPGETTVADLKAFHLDPSANPNITILNYTDVLRRFLPNPSFSVADLDPQVRDCISAKTECRGYLVDQSVVKRRRNGNFWADLLGFSRHTDVAGWKFQGLVLIKQNVVVYKLTGGQPAIRQQEDASTPLGPIQGVGEKLFSTLPL